MTALLVVIFLIYFGALVIIEEYGEYSYYKMQKKHSSSFYTLKN